MSKINSINKITSFSGLEIAVQHYLEEGTLSEKMIDAIAKKHDQLKVYTGFYIGTSYDCEKDYYYVLLINDEGVQKCIIYTEKDYIKLWRILQVMDKSKLVLINGNGLFIQDNIEIKFNTLLNTAYEE